MKAILQNLTRNYWGKLATALTGTFAFVTLTVHVGLEPLQEEAPDQEKPTGIDPEEELAVNVTVVGLLL